MFKWTACLVDMSTQWAGSLCKLFVQDDCDVVGEHGITQHPSNFSLMSVSTHPGISALVRVFTRLPDADLFTMEPVGSVFARPSARVHQGPPARGAALASISLPSVISLSAGKSQLGCKIAAPQDPDTFISLQVARNDFHSPDWILRLNTLPPFSFKSFYLGVGGVVAKMFKWN